jgi:hypothetical protein
MKSSSHFGDKRLDVAYHMMLQSMHSSSSSVIHQLGNHGIQAKYYRCLNNKKVSRDSIVSLSFGKTVAALGTRKSVFLVQDTTLDNVTKKKGRLLAGDGLGRVGRGKMHGHYEHAGICVGDDDLQVLGLGYLESFHHSEFPEIHKERGNLDIEEKESNRWLKCAKETRELIPESVKITYISDRESDIYEYFVLLISLINSEFVVRVSHENRLLLQVQGKPIKLKDHLKTLKVKGYVNVTIPASGSTKKRIARLAVYSSEVTLKLPAEIKTRMNKAQAAIDIRREAGEDVTNEAIKSYPESITINVVNVVEVNERNEVIKGGIHWTLFTNKPTETVEDAFHVACVYKVRWLVEDVFRPAKLDGYRMEQCDLKKPENHLKMSAIIMELATKALSLRQNRENEVEDANIMFTDWEIECMEVVNQALEGAEKQNNPYRHKSLAWSIWILARLGSWSGYKSQGMPGTKCLIRGLEKFYNQYDMWVLLKKSG